MTVKYMICLQIRWFTTYFNKTIIKLGSRKSKYMKIWFNIGVVFSLVLMVMSAILLIMIVENTLRQKVVDQQILTPVVSSFYMKKIPKHLNIFYECCLEGTRCESSY